MADDGGVDIIFVYLGGEQVVPDDVTHFASIDPSKLFRTGHSVGVKSWSQ